MRYLHLHLVSGTKNLASVELRPFAVGGAVLRKDPMVHTEIYYLG